MPLDKSGGKAAIGSNIRELRAAGYPHKQRVAIALDTQRRAGGLTGTKRGKQPKRAPRRR